ncbi:type I polyketide synthase [Alcaligenaceae bacterium C4P045]|nr:type I polyketide synthase [Alcaligenaceae bacterium C4P045]
MSKRVAIIGYSFRFPGTTTSNYWQDLLNGADLVTEVEASRWADDAYLHPAKSQPGTAYTFAAGSIGDVSGFDAAFFGISPREAALMDPQQRVLMELCWEAMEHAGVKPSALRGSDCAVYIGIASADYSYRFADDLSAVDSSIATGNTASIAANRLSYAFDLRGPSMAVDTACSSSLVAFHQACQSILSGESTHAVAGGVSLHLHPYGFITFSKASMLSRSGRCQVFDAAGDGYVRSEGGGLFLLKDYDQAVADGDRIIAVVANTSVNTDGKKSGLTVPSADAQIALMRRAYEQAGIDPARIDYLEAHGTGTAVGDPIETRAIGEALGKTRPKGDPLPIGSVKSNMGHLEAASGVAGLVKALHCLEHREVPATIGIKTLNPLIEFDAWNIDVVQARRALRATGDLVVGVNSFGFGGANAHVVLLREDSSRAPKVNKLAKTAPIPMVVSGKTADALKAAALNMAAALADSNSAHFYDIAYHAVQRREWHEHRALVFGTNGRDVAKKLADFADDTAVKFSVQSGTAVPNASGPVFIYSGNGSQWAGMGRRLLEDPVFAEAIHEVDALFSAYADYSLENELAGRNGDDRYAFTEIAQPALFAIQVGVTRMLRQRGVTPVAVAGHSVGEVAAAWACGALPLAQAVKVIFHRSRLQGTTKGSGQMTGVGIDGDAVEALIASLKLDAVCVAGRNSSSGSTVAGHPDQLTILESALAKQRTFCKRLDLDYAFHSPAMAEIEADLREALSDISPQASTIPFYSAVTGEPIEGGELDAEYWWRNIREPVLFQPAVNALVAQGHNVFVEVGPHPVLRSYLNHALKDAALEGQVFVTAARGDDDPARVRAAAGSIMVAGVDTDWSSIFPWVGKHVDLPGYPWQRERHWHPVTQQSLGLLERHNVHPLLGHPLRQHANTWEARLDTLLHPWLADHVVGGATVFPGTGFAEIALAAALQAHATDVVEIEELEIHAPLLLAEEPSKLLRITVDATDGRIDISAKELNSDEPWTRHASARILQQANAATLTAREPLPAPRDAIVFTGEQHVAMTQAAGLDYGPAFQAIARGYHEADGVVVACLQLPATLATQQEDAQTALHLHPALLDCTFQLIIQLLADEAAADRGMAFVPAKMGRIIVRAGNAVPHTVRARLLRRAPHSLVAEFELFDAKGVHIAAIRDARFRSIRLRKSAAEHLDFLDYAGTLQPHPLRAQHGAAPIAASTLHEALASAAATAGDLLSGQRYANEVDPLLDSLCARFTIEALRELCSDGAHLSSATVMACRKQGQDAAVLLDRLLARTIEDGMAHATTSGWTILPDGEESPSAEDIWNSLVREYPDYFPAVQAVGRVGLHLTALLRGKIGLDEVRPAHVTPAALAALMQGTDAREHIAKTIARQLRDAQLRTTHRRVRVLELGAEGPVFGVACCNAIDPTRGDYRYVSLDDSLPEAAQRLHERFPDADVMTRSVADDASAPVDLAIVSADFSSLEETRAALEYAGQHLAPDGVLLFSGQHPASWLDFIFGGHAAWWVDSPTKTKVSSAQGIAFWQHELAQTLNTEAKPALGFITDANAGAYVLVGSHATAAPAVNATSRAGSAASSATVQSGASWLLLADENGADRDIAVTLLAHLVQAGARARIVAAHDTTSIAAHFSAITMHAKAAVNVVMLAGLNLPQQLAQDTADADALVSLQAERCAHTAGLVQVFERQHVPATLWLITRNAMQSLAFAEVPAQPASQLAALNDAALWAFGRTLMNEASNFRVRLVDLPLDARESKSASTQDVVNALSRELLHPTDEHEVVLTADGSRYAPRLRPQARPVNVAATTVANDNVRLGFEFPGQLRNLRWEACPSIAPADDELEVEIRATGLNFRDVMYALGLLADEAIENGFAGPSLGLEFAGVVTRIGANVAGYAIGDAVVGFGPTSFSARTLTKASAISHIPAGFSFEAAATIPSTFFTVYYALNHLAHLEAGEKILIHGAAGGVGIAAIQFAQWRGAEIHATAGSPEKRDFLRLMGVKHIYDSRALTYADEILRATDGRGVDVVLNSLAGEAINRNLNVLKPFGRFLELGKRDFYENTRIGLRPFRNNISYFGIDADQLMHERPALTHRLFGEMMALFQQGVLHPLPYRAFDANQVVDAFRYMQQARQIGKIVVTYREPLRHVAQARAAAKPVLTLQSDATYLVTGGLGGFGLRTAQWLVEKGARNLVLLSRSGPASEVAQAAIGDFEAAGVKVLAAACDVTDRDAVAGLLAQAALTLPPLRGIVHAATVIDDGLIRSTDLAQINNVLRPKIVGATHLHQLTLDVPLDFFVMFSSATTLFGNPGQGNYVAANGWLEALAQHRRANGLAATCVRWGAIDDVGFLARNEKIKDALQGRMGGHALHSNVALSALEDMMLTDASGLGVLDLDWRALARFLPSAESLKFDALARRNRGGEGDDGGAEDIALMLETLAPEALHERFVDMLKSEVGEILRVSNDKIDAACSLYDMGLDSLMGVELVVALESRFGVRLPVMALSESPTINRLAERMITMLRGDDAPIAIDALTAQANQIAAQHSQDVSQDEIALLTQSIKSGTSASTSRMIQ